MGTLPWIMFGQSRLLVRREPRSDLMTSTCRAITRTLNEHYQTQRYGLGGANTTYPISAFITDLVYLEGTGVHVDVKKITVRFLVY